MLHYNVKPQPAVYKIIREDSKKIYIGSTLNASKRMRSHLKMLEKGKHENKYLQKDYNDGYNFNCEIIQYYEGLIDKMYLNILEYSYIFNNYKDDYLYNIEGFKSSFTKDKYYAFCRNYAIMCSNYFIKHGIEKKDN